MSTTIDCMGEVKAHHQARDRSSVTYEQVLQARVLYNVYPYTLFIGLGLVCIFFSLHARARNVLFISSVDSIVLKEKKAKTILK